MTHLVYTAEDNQADREIELLTPNNGAPIAAHIRDVATAQDLYDHVVLTVADLPSPVAGAHNLTTGSWAFPASLNLGTNGILVPTGVTAYLAGFGWDKTITTSATSGLVVQGTALIDGLSLVPSGTQGIDINNAVYCEVRDVLVASGATYGVLVRGTTGEAMLVGTRATGTTVGLLIQAGGSTNVKVRGGSYNGADGVRFNGSCSRASFVQATLNGTVNGVNHNGGAQGAVQINGCWVVGGALGISWPAANIPTKGLVVLGSDFTSAAAFGGHTAASARVNYKDNTTVGGLLTETAIVP